ncbi:MAG: endopeptidase La [Deltaproteobacteria bacterium]|jgi:ATP-dependent Lon protease|nr:endopeptidase La [Deltaproteobacteria bacterium]
MTEQLGYIEIATELPLLAVRDVVVFNDMLLPLFVAREQSLIAVEAALNGNKQIMICAQKDPSTAKPGADDIHGTGTIAYIMRQAKYNDSKIKILVQGLAKARILRFKTDESYYRVQTELVMDEPEPKSSHELEALVRAVREQSQKILALREVLSEEIVTLLESVEKPGKLADLVISNLKVKVGDAQKVLEETDPKKRLMLVNQILNIELKVSTMQAKFESEARNEMDRSQKEYYLREQLRAIKRELGDDSGREQEANDYKLKMKKAHLPKEVQVEANKQLSRLEWMQADSAESAVIRTYLDWLVELPWAISTKDHLDLAEAKKILDRDHYDLAKVKDRILELLAVKKLNNRQKGPIICFLGPPGVGKTSLGKSIAKAMGRKFARFSLGGMKDEAEIRGHRRTYIGALPGRIIQSIKAVGSNNPVLMLDEVDKIGADFRGDPASALLEVLDPEQNHGFSDHYLNVPFDLSKVMFITTANSTYTIPAALEDRMEIIELPGYSLEEKVSIAKEHLLPRLLTDHGLKSENLVVRDSAIKAVISSYTDESGVRSLERQLASVCRKVARKLAESPTGEMPLQKITSLHLGKLLGPPSVIPEPKLNEGQIGVATGLAWSDTGGSVLFVEIRDVPGQGNLSMTGQLGDVMKESAWIVIDLVRFYAQDLGLKKDFFANTDIHIHVPAGSVPKEGPSAGLAIFAALLSSLLNIPCPKDIAMTGELTLRGQVMAIGGLKEKALAALRHGIRKVIIPRQNQKDLAEIPPDLRKRITFTPIDGIGDLIRVLFPELHFRPGKPDSQAKLQKPKSKPYRVPKPSGRQPGART